MDDLTREIAVEVTVGSEGAETGAARSTAALDSIAAGADKAGTAGAAGLGKLESGLTAAAKAADPIAAQIAKIETSLATAKDSWDSPRALGRAAGVAEIQVKDLGEAIARARSTGAPISPDAEAALQRFEARMTEVKLRVGSTTDTLGDMRKQGALAGDTFRTLAQGGGSVQGVLQLMDDAGKGWVGTLGKIGIASFAAVEGMKLLKEIFDKVSEGSKLASEEIVRLAAKQADLKSGATEQAAAQRAVAEGLITAGRNIGETIERWKSYVVETKHAEQADRAFIEAHKDILKMPDVFEKTKTEAVDFEIALAAAFNKGKTNFLEFAITNEDGLKRIAAAYKLNGEAAPDYVNRAIKALEEHKKALDSEEAALKKSQAAIDEKLKAYQREFEIQEKVGQGINQIVEGSQKDIAAGTAAAEVHEKIEQSLRDMAAGLGLTGEQLRLVVDKAIAYKQAVDQAHEADETLIPGVEAATAAIEAQRDALPPTTEELAAWAAEMDASTEAQIRAKDKLHDTEEALRQQGLAAQEAEDRLSGFSQNVVDFAGTLGQLDGALETTTNLLKPIAPAQKEWNAEEADLINQLAILAERMGALGVPVETFLFKLKDGTIDIDATKEAIRQLFETMGGAVPINSPAYEDFLRILLKIKTAGDDVTKTITGMGDAFEQTAARSTVAGKTIELAFQGVAGAVSHTADQLNGLGPSLADAIQYHGVH